MKKILFTLFIGLSTFTISAQKELTLEDAVMNQYRAYYPKNTVKVQWIPNTSNYVYLSNDYQTLLKGNTKNDKTIELINTATVSELTGQKLGWLNIVSWENQNEFYIKASTNYYKINIPKKEATKIATVLEKGAN